VDREASPPYCQDCGEEGEGESLLVVGTVLEAEPVPKKDKLTKLRVDVGGGAVVTVVTNAKYCEAGKRVVVARPGARLPGLEELVARATVGGVRSEGMVCDSAMLGWAGGAAGQAVFLPESFGPGDLPPTARPRGDLGT
jgi:phenylalanyl-tRNA synthetase beta chain